MPKDLLQDLFIYSAARLFPAALSMLFTLTCIQTLTSEQYALYSLATLPSLVAAAFVGGLAGQPLMRFGSQLSGIDLAHALITVPALGTFVALVPVIFWWFWQGLQWTTIVLPFSLLLVPTIAFVDSRRSYLIAVSQPAKVFWLDSSRALSGLVSFWALSLIFPISELSPIAAMVCGATVALLFSQRQKFQSSNKASINIDREYLKYGAWVAGWMALIAVFPLAERALLERTHGLEVAGIYSAMSDPMITLMAAGTSVGVSAVLPRFVSAWEAGESNHIRRLTNLGLLVSLSVALLALLFGSLIAYLGIGRFGQLLRNFPGLACSLLAVTAAWQAAVFAHKPLELMRRVDLMFVALGFAWIVFACAAMLLVAPFAGLGILAAKGIALFSYIALVKLAINFAKSGKK